MAAGGSTPQTAKIAGAEAWTQQWIKRQGENQYYNRINHTKDVWQDGQSKKVKTAISEEDKPEYWAGVQRRLDSINPNFSPDNGPKAQEILASPVYTPTHYGPGPAAAAGSETPFTPQPEPTTPSTSTPLPSAQAIGVAGPVLDVVTKQQTKRKGPGRVNTESLSGNSDTTGGGAGKTLLGE